MKGVCRFGQNYACVQESCAEADFVTERDIAWRPRVNAYYTADFVTRDIAWRPRVNVYLVAMRLLVVSTLYISLSVTKSTDRQLSGTHALIDIPLSSRARALWLSVFYRPTHSRLSASSDIHDTSHSFRTFLFFTERVDKSNIKAPTATSKCRLTASEDAWVVWAMPPALPGQHFVTERVKVARRASGCTIR